MFEKSLPLTGVHCEIDQSEAPQQPKQLDRRKHTRTKLLGQNYKLPQIQSSKHSILIISCKNNASVNEQLILNAQ